VPGRKNKKRKPSPRNSVNSQSLRASSKLKLRSSSHNISSSKLKLRSSSHNISSSKLKPRSSSRNISSSKLKLRNNSRNISSSKLRHPNSNISSKPAGSNNSRTALPNNSKFTNSKLAIRTLPSAHSKPWRLNALSRLFA